MERSSWMEAWRSSREFTAHLQTQNNTSSRAKTLVTGSHYVKGGGGHCLGALDLRAGVGEDTLESCQEVWQEQVDARQAFTEQSGRVEENARHHLPLRGLRGRKGKGD